MGPKFYLPKAKQTKRGLLFGWNFLLAPERVGACPAMAIKIKY